LDYKSKNGITPKTIEKEIKNILEQFGLENRSLYDKKHCQKILEIDLTGDARPLEEIIKDKKNKK